MGVAQPLFSCTNGAFTPFAQILIMRTTNDTLLITSLDGGGAVTDRCEGGVLHRNQWQMLTFAVDDAAVFRVWNNAVLLAECHGLRMPLNIVRDKCAIGRSWLPSAIPNVMPVSPSFFDGQLAGFQVWERSLYTRGANSRMDTAGKPRAVSSDCHWCTAEAIGMESGDDEC